MTIEELKKLLDEGKITKEQFKTMALAIDPDFKEDDPDPDPDKGKDKKPDIEKLIQQAVDRATNKLGNDNKRLREELDTIKKEKLTAEERAELERKQEREQFEQERAEFQKEKNKLYAVKAIKAAGLDDGSDKALELVNFVMGSDEKEIDSRVKAFGDLVKKETGKSAQEYIQLKMIDAAKEGLLDPNKTIGQVAYELGFQYPQHFSRLFKKNVGCTPNEYKQQS